VRVRMLKSSVGLQGGRRRKPRSGRDNQETRRLAKENGGTYVKGNA